jgi:penicillin-binding protein 1B
MDKIDKATNLLADDSCPDSFYAAFLPGTAPTETCDHPADRPGDHSPEHRNVLQKILGLGK